MNIILCPREIYVVLILEVYHFVLEILIPVLEMALSHLVNPFFWI